MAFFSFFLQKSNNIFWASVVTLEIWLVVVAAVTPNVKSIQTFLGWIPCCEIIHYAHPSSFCCAISHGWPLCIGLMLLLLLIFTPGDTLYKYLHLQCLLTTFYTTRGLFWNIVLVKIRSNVKNHIFQHVAQKISAWKLFSSHNCTATFWPPCK